MDGPSETTTRVDPASESVLVPVHPEPVVDDAQSLRWSMPAATLDFVGVPSELPTALQRLLDEKVLSCLTVEPAAIRTRLDDGLTWRDHGARVRTALQTALAAPEQWRTGSSAPPADELLTLAVQQVIDGDVGDYIRSHGGRVELVSARDHEVEIQLSGACSHCPASDVTLTDRLETGIRVLYPRLARLSARNEPGSGTGRRLLRMLPTRHR